MNKFLFISIIIVFNLFCKGSNFYQNPNDSINADSLLAFSKLQIGTKYNYANCSPTSGFDCSGFVFYVFNHFKIKVPRSSRDFTNFGEQINPDSCQVGDVIIFTGTNAKNRTAGHVGIIITKLGDEMKFIHSSSNKKNSGVKISTYKKSPYYKIRFLKIVRVTTVF